ncbi:hypothetical protein O9K51_11489 [Purpureocillium lavendulum]|uniref:J domain-containing protein n=1 Tax=Purpureocillium lavendulum TaxID=1247861 RepID=A0AB34FA00_9HYPO|nr:hypothetical protein O9K51_11489 [Purpureocillium lavendulum]
MPGSQQILPEGPREAAQHQSPSASAALPTQSSQDAAKAVDEEIERIMKCPKGVYAEILSVDPDSSDADKLIAWRRLSCMMHPHYCRQKNAKDAFEKLQDAASKIGVDQPFLGEVYSWDGKADLQADDDLDGEETDDERRIEEDDIPIPPTRVNDAYREATALLHNLGENPEDEAVLKQLKGINDRKDCVQDRVPAPAQRRDDPRRQRRRRLVGWFQAEAGLPEAIATVLKQFGIKTPIASRIEVSEDASLFARLEQETKEN